MLIENSRKPRFVAAIGDANDPATYSGIPFHLLEAGRAAGVLDAGLPLVPYGPAWTKRRVFWNVRSLVRLDRAGGYQYSVPFLERLWAPFVPALKGSLVLNCFQLYPPSVVGDDSIEKWFFIDQTLTQLFDCYGLRSTIGRSIAREALVREGAGYTAGRGILVNNRWARQSVIRDYGIDPGNVHLVVPGASLRLTDLDGLAPNRKKTEWAASPGSAGRVRFVFVGREWKRKGLDRLLHAFSRVRLQAPSVLRVIGCERSQLPRGLRNVPGVEWIGLIDKRREARRFVDAVAECDVGCLLSRAEAAAIAIREFHALGLPVLATRVGGIPDSACPEASWLLEPEAGVEEIAQKMLEIAADSPVRAALRDMLLARRSEFLYESTVARIGMLLN